ncbi:MAG TPA: asparagine synthase-related protein [Acidobacteriaceae bacterium]|nr:asparagine synthase-related protein [Acidobacteriaceae bacterium]
MAGISGIFCADGRPAELAELKRMVASAEHRGPDGITYWNDGPVALAHLQFHTTPESLDERQPLVSPGGEACLVWNGRVDNREDLLRELAAANALPSDQTDPGLALAAYLAWGEDCVQHIVGDFAFAVWDKRHRRLWCARDYIGIRPFYYFWDGKTFLFGPEIRALLAHPLVSLSINEGMAGEYLANAITSREETLYSDIRRLPAGSTLTVDASRRLRIDRWWRPELSLIEYGSDEEYAEHFRHLFDQAIRAQIRCNTPWGVQLSGGLDSSSIAVSARAVLDASGAKDSPILTFSMACPGKPWDESEDIAATVKRARLTPEFVLPMQADVEFFRQRAAFWRDFPGNPNGEPMTIPMYNAARRKGARVVLSGIGGDEWLDGRQEHLSDLAASMLFRQDRASTARQLLERAKDDWKVYSGAGRWQVFLTRRLIADAAPEWAHSRRRSLKLSRGGIFSREFLQRVHLADRLSDVPFLKRDTFASRTQQAVFQIVTAGYEAQVFEWNDREAACAGAEVRFPFFNRRLTEFCLRLPEDQRQRGSVWKLLLRNAMEGRLPERLCGKMYKAEFSELFENVVSAPQCRVRLTSPAMLRRTDWLDSERFVPHMDSMIRSGRLRPMWLFLGVDLWFESILSQAGQDEGVASRMLENPSVNNSLLPQIQT